MTREGDSHDSTTTAENSGIAGEEEDVKEYDHWRQSRRGIVHTLDISPVHSAHAVKTILNFRHGLYFGNVDFHVGALDTFLAEKLSSHHQQQFLDHVVLDLPSSDKYVELVAKALKSDGTLVIFNPSVTQIVDCVREVRQRKIPLVLDRVLEVGYGSGGGAREWDVKLLKQRHPSGTKESKSNASLDDTRPDGDDLSNLALQAANDNYTIVCRPKIGGRVVAGGFLGIFKRLKY
jgi:hypothetical protein